MALRILRLIAVASILALGFTARTVTTTHAFTDDPAAGAPAVVDPIAEPGLPSTLTDPTLTDPTLTDPTLTDPTLTDPTLTDPTLTDPTLTDPAPLPEQTPVPLEPPVELESPIADPIDPLPTDPLPTDPLASDPPSTDSAEPTPTVPPVIEPSPAIDDPAVPDPPMAPESSPVIESPTLETDPPLPSVPPPSADVPPLVEDPAPTPTPAPAAQLDASSPAAAASTAPVRQPLAPAPSGPAQSSASPAGATAAAPVVPAPVANPPAAAPIATSAEPILSKAPGALPNVTVLVALDRLEPISAGLAAGVAVTNRAPATVAVALEFGRAGGGWAGAIVFNLWLRRQLRERRMSQRQLAALSGVDHSTISRLLQQDRSPSLATATKLARAFRHVQGESDTADYFERMPEDTLFPARRVEMALRADELLDDADVMRLMSVYLDARRRRQGVASSNGRSPTAPTRAGTGGAPTRPTSTSAEVDLSS